MSIVVAGAVRLLLVLLFLPFSALDKILNPARAVAQAEQVVSSTALARFLIFLGLSVEIFMSLGILSGYADRMAAFVLSGYCITTALLWKRFWRSGDFSAKSNSEARTLFWDFWKNMALAGGFLLITFGTSAGSVDHFLKAPLSSTDPYGLSASPTP
jgi:putative oxidoreductase